MEQTSEMLLVTGDSMTRQSVATALSRSKRLAVAGLCGSVSELSERLESTGAVVALVDIDPAPHAMLIELDSVINRFPDVRFLVLARDRRSDLILEAMQIGVRHFLLKESIEAELPEVLHRLFPNGQPRLRRHGSIYTVLSAGGGCGATTLAVNLANELAIECASPSLVADMDLAYGAVGCLLGLTGQYGLADVLTHKGRIDQELIASTAVTASASLHVLLSPACTKADGPVTLPRDRVDEMLKTLVSGYQNTVIDAPRVPIDVATALAAASRLIVVVFQLNIKDLACARNLMEGLTNGGIPGDAVLPVANRYCKSRLIISSEDARRLLGRSVFLISNDYAGAMLSMNKAKPLADVAARSSLRRDIRNLMLQYPGPGSAVRTGSET